MTKKVVFSICTAMIVVFSFGFFKVNFLDRKESKLTVTNVDLQENCIYAIAKNQLYDADDEYIIHGASDYLKGQVQLSQIRSVYKELHADHETGLLTTKQAEYQAPGKCEIFSLFCCPGFPKGHPLAHDFACKV